MKMKQMIAMMLLMMMSVEAQTLVYESNSTVEDSNVTIVETTYITGEYDARAIHICEHYEGKMRIACFAIEDKRTTYEIVTTVTKGKR